MKAIVYEQTGPSSVLQMVELPKPEPGPGEVLVRLCASGINPSDTKTRAGIFPLPQGWTQIVPHNDGAGVIEAVGEGVPQARAAERVWVHSAQRDGRAGTAAEYVVVAAHKAVALPENVPFDAGATLGVPALTAWRAVTMDGPVKDKALLVQGGAGAVGICAIQIAKAGGARVIASISSERKGDVAREAGADHVVNYRTQNMADAIAELTGGRGVDQVIEVNLGANAIHLPSIVANNGFISVYGSSERMIEFPAIGCIAAQLRFGFFLVYSLPHDVLQTGTSELTRLLQADALQPVVAKRFTLQQTPQAHDFVDSGDALGNAVIVI